MALQPMYNGIPFSPIAQLVSNIGAADTVIEVTNISAFPAAPNLATIGMDDSAETIMYSAIVGNSLSGCVRGIEGTAQIWTADTIISRNWTAYDYTQLIANIAYINGLAVSAGSDAAAAALAAASVQSALTTHINDTGKHVTALLQQTWNTGAQTASDAKALAQTAQYAADNAASVAGTALQGVKVNGTLQSPDGSKVVDITVSPTIPMGVILFWSGAVNSIPGGWALCNGSNGTPDLRDKFIVGAGGAYSPGNTGGAASVALDEVNLPSHKHTIPRGVAFTQATGTSYGVLTGSTTTIDTGNTGSGTAHENRPPYYALCMIMKM